MSDRQDPHDLTGTTVAQYEIEEHLGGGGMGVVYTALDTRLGRRVALKFLPPFMSHVEDARTRFFAEARSASALDHPNICTVHEIGETEDGRVFIAMTLYGGETLKKKIARGGLPMVEALDYAIQAARGLASAHSKDIVHRDIKPANLMVTDDDVLKIVDFGTAKMGDLQLTATGMSLGTVSYMSPEQVEGEKVDHRTDLWSLGVVLYEMLSGRSPFKGSNPAAIIYSIMSEDPPPLSGHDSTIPDQVQFVVSRCLEKDPEHRYADAAELLDDLEATATSVGWTGRGSSGQISTTRPVHRSGRSKWVGAGLAAALAVALALPGTRGVLSGIFGGGEASALTYLAVLPFGSTDPADEVIAAGLTHSLTGMISSLQQVDDSLWVVPASEIRNEGITTAREARASFSVNTVLTGMVQRSGTGPQIQLDLVGADQDTPRLLGSRTLPSPDDPAFQGDVRVALASLLGLGSNAEAERAMAREAAVSPDAYALYVEGLGYLQRYYDEENILAAIGLFEAAIEQDSTYALAIAGLCEARWEQFTDTGEPDVATAAIRSCDDAAALSDDNPAVLVTLGIAYQRTGEYGKALLVINRALELDPGNARAYQWLGRVYEAQGRGEESEAAYRRAIDAQPGNWAYYYDLGILHMYGDGSKAREQFEHVVRLAPDNSLGFTVLGSSAMLAGDFAEATLLLETSIEKKPTALAYRNLAFIALNESEFEEAIALVEEAHALNDRDRYSWRYKAQAYGLRGQDAEARAAWERFIELTTPLLQVNPDEVDPVVGMAEAYVALGDRETGREYLDHAVELPRQWAYTTWYVGRVYEMLGDRDAALRYLEEALTNGQTPLLIDKDHWLVDLRADPRYAEMRARF